MDTGTSTEFVAGIGSLLTIQQQRLALTKPKMDKETRLRPGGTCNNRQSYELGLDA